MLESGEHTVRSTPQVGSGARSACYLPFCGSASTDLRSNRDLDSQIGCKQLVAPDLSFVLINLLAVIAIYAFEVSFSVGIIIPFCMVEGALVYWLLEKRASAFDD
ncbi:hypothetical protein SPHINGOR109_10682 [Sphingorhabdus sp. 109]|jgi:hypothetical protein|nr:hypothetical protein SPHINGOR109_10682 [Sphingorhabdus sp. 109]